jgi:hypothetical protein
MFRKSYVNPVVNKISGFYVILLISARFCNVTGGYVKPHYRKITSCCFPLKNGSIFFFTVLRNQKLRACRVCACTLYYIFMHVYAFHAHFEAITIR